VRGGGPEDTDPTTDVNVSSKWTPQDDRLFWYSSFDEQTMAYGCDPCFVFHLGPLKDGKDSRLKMTV
jgi:hypothetical protein